MTAVHAPPTPGARRAPDGREGPPAPARWRSSDPAPSRATTG